MASNHRDSRPILLVILAIAGLPTTTAAQQVFERDREIRGPNGKTIDRRVRIERTPGAVTREIDIRRPDGVYHRSVTMPTGPRPPGPGPGPMARGYFGPMPPPPHHGGPSFWEGAAGFGVPFAGALAGSMVGNALATPRPPVVAAPVVVAPAPWMVATPVSPAPPPAPATTPTPAPINDPLPAEIEKLRSWIGTTRMDAALLLGKVGDPRAVPALIRAMRDDHKDEVRENAALALGLIGDPSARPYLEVASTSDSKRKVREAALKALGLIDQAQAASVVANPTPAGTVEVGAQPRLDLESEPSPRMNKPAIPPPVPQPIPPSQMPR